MVIIALPPGRCGESVRDLDECECPEICHERPAHLQLQGLRVSCLFERAPGVFFHQKRSRGWNTMGTAPSGATRCLPGHHRTIAAGSASTHMVGNCIRARPAPPRRTRLFLLFFFFPLCLVCADVHAAQFRRKSRLLSQAVRLGNRAVVSGPICRWFCGDKGGNGDRPTSRRMADGSPPFRLLRSRPNHHQGCLDFGRLPPRSQQPVRQFVPPERMSSETPAHRGPTREIIAPFFHVAER